jgi:hypothetical protein
VGVRKEAALGVVSVISKQNNNVDTMSSLISLSLEKKEGRKEWMRKRGETI